MKKLLLLLLLPVLSYAQSYEDLITITDLQIFKKVLSENYYEKVSSNDSNVTYAYKKEVDSLGNNVALRWAEYRTSENVWVIQIADRGGWFDVYSNIFNDVQRNCEFQYVEEVSDTQDVSYYKCNDIVLGFGLDDGNGIIMNRPVPKTNTE